MQRRHSSISWIGVVGFVVLLSAFASNGGSMPATTAISLVIAHLAAMAVALLFCGASRSESLNRFGIRDLMAITVVVALFGSLSRICLRWIPFDNLSIAGKITMTAVVIGTGWALVTVLADVVGSLVWWLVRYRNRRS